MHNLFIEYKTRNFSANPTITEKDIKQDYLSKKFKKELSREFDKNWFKNLKIDNLSNKSIAKKEYCIALLPGSILPRGVVYEF